MTAQEMREITIRLMGELRTAEELLGEETLALAATAERLTSIEEARSIVQTIAQTIQQKVHGRIAAVVSRCLSTVFESPYEFKIEFEQKRGRTEARLVFSREGHEVDPLTEAGGGVVDVAAFALRVACLVLTRPAGRRVLVLDEPLLHLNGEDQQRRFGQVIMAVAKDLSIQIILATDDQWLKLGKVIEL